MLWEERFRIIIPKYCLISVLSEISISKIIDLIGNLIRKFCATNSIVFNTFKFLTEPSNQGLRCVVRKRIYSGLC